jgi:hypothetical protein
MAVKQRERRRQRIARQVARTGRREERRAKQQANFVGPYTPRQAKKVAKNQVRTEYRPTERQIASEIRGSKKREGQIQDWYTQLQSQYAQGAQQAASAADAANASTAATLGQTSANTANLLQGLASKDAAFAAQVGGPTNVAGQQTQVEAAAAAERLRAALQAPIAAERASNIASYGSKGATAVLAGIQAHKEEAGRRRKEQTDLRALKGERGAAVVKALQTLREQDQTYTTQQAALGVKTNEVGAKEHYNRALEQQAKLGLKGKQVTAAAQEAAARAYAKAKERGASAQEAVAAAQKAAAAISAKSNENVARQQGRNAKAKAKNSGGYTVGEAAKLAKAAGIEFKTPGEVVQYLVNRGVKEEVAKKAAARAWRAAHAG